MVTGALGAPLEFPEVGSEGEGLTPGRTVAGAEGEGLGPGETDGGMDGEGVTLGKVGVGRGPK